ncbi:PD-(D/E)XK nuclease family protein [Helicobacter sp. faydin-H20]|uniref:PD-(D/E)XK nuclease family protein n=1 Tax=Helicobacter anatolicus TaxID=2905874 RepID=UPI001E2C0D64|nr:PD-(D/E)XK nuclease family protein [Helicobacter anatolicus]MCE3036692.1 PD-(D/E)XK nuclease family protein [Helicobacter anatolicus]
MLDSKNLYVFSSRRAIGDFYLEFDGDFAPRVMSAQEFFESCIVIEDKKRAPKFVMKFLLLQTLYEYKNTHKLVLFDKSFLAYLEGMEFLENFFTELDLSRKKIEDISILDTYEDYEEHLKILKDIYENFQEKLKNYQLYRNFYSQNYEIYTDIFANIERIDFFLDGVLSLAEQEILIKIARDKKLILHFECDAYNKKFFNFLEISTLKEDVSYQVDLQNKEILEESENKEYRIVEAFSFASRIQQVAFAIHQAGEWLKEGRENVALITPSEDFVKYLQVFDIYRNFNYAVGMDIKKTAYYKEFVTQDMPENLVSFQEKIQEIAKKHLQFQEEIKLFNQEFFSGLSQIQETIDIFSMEDIREFYLKELEGLKISDNRGGKIPVYGMLETRGMHFDSVAIVDFNEEKIFNFSDSDMFLNTKIRKEIGMPTLEDRQNLQKHYYYQLIKNSKEVKISFVEDAKLQMSYFLQNIGHVQYKNFNRTLFDFNAISPYQEDEFIGQIPADFIFSASSLRDFFTCKRRFYFKYCKKLANKSDNFLLYSSFHKILEEVYKAYKGRINPVLMKKEFEEKIRGLPFMDRVEAFSAEVFLKNMRGFWDREKEHFNNCEFFQAEYEFKTEIFGKKFTGKIDRIDKIGEKYLIIDYKFGKNIKLQAASEEMSDFQLVIYALALENEGKEVQSCRIYAMQNNQVLIEEDLMQKVEILEKKLKELDGVICFDKCKKNTECQFCDFAILCNRS